MHTWRHQAEKLFLRVKEFRAVARRPGKADESVALASHVLAGVNEATSVSTCRIRKGSFT